MNPLPADTQDTPSRVPALRVETLNDAPWRSSGRHVLYWSVAYRRSTWNFALDRAIERARALEVPLIVLEALRCDYPWASDRIHAFVLAGMRDQKSAYADSPVRYLPYVEPEPGAGRGLLEALSTDACGVVTDAFPSFFLPRMQAAAARRLGELDVPLERIDSVGLFPMGATSRVFPSAHTFRRQLQKDLRPHLEHFPWADPLHEAGELPTARLPKAITDRWGAPSKALLQGDPKALAALPIDHDVRVADEIPGGPEAAEACLERFLEAGLPRYAEDRNHPDAPAASGLSPYLHFGHASTHGVFDALARRESWSPARISDRVTGSREGWWGFGPAAEAFLDELITWREVGFNMSSKVANYDRFESLPDFARTTLNEHRDDPRPYVYSLEEFENARTHDEIWNAAQRELVRTGRMHNYLRMLWGKKVLEWTKEPEAALEILIHLNNKYALDGRNPNSYSGIFWCLGRYDRAWGPEREVFGKIRFMSSDSTRRKLRLTEYLERFGEPTLFG